MEPRSRERGNAASVAMESAEQALMTARFRLTKVV